ncbi:hypothetical protein [Microcoleus sp.]|uniref:hypothetical protein n=1 Tax=Microcoleus sp. TaxID=44472 RepID=UPI0035943453
MKIDDFAVGKRHCRILPAPDTVDCPQNPTGRETAVPCPPRTGHGSAVSLQNEKIL